MPRDWRSDDTSNYLGTYTFESLDAYEAGRPRSYTRRIGDPNIDVRELPGRVLRAGRHPRAPQPDAERRPALRSADACRRLRQRDAAPRRHLGAVHRRPDDAARELGHLPRLAADEHLRADAARRRLPPAGDRHRQSAVSGASASCRCSPRPAIATCWATMSCCRARRASASASISATSSCRRAPPTPTCAAARWRAAST